MVTRQEVDQAIVKAPSGVPAYLDLLMQEDNSKDALKQYQVVPRMKVVQDTAKKELKDLFASGDIINNPGRQLLAAYNRKESRSAPIGFIPILFFTEFIVQADLKDTINPSVLDRTYNERSPIAIKARSKEDRKEKYGQGWTKRYVECLNFIGELELPGMPYDGILTTLTYSKGDFSIGKNFCTVMLQCKVPIFAQKFSLFSSYRDKGADKKWYGIDFNREDNTELMLNQDRVLSYRSKHIELKEALQKDILRVDHDNEDEDTLKEAAAASNNEM